MLEKIIYNRQFGFQEGHLTEDTNFDYTVDHQISISKLQSYRVTASSLCWYGSYLKTKKMQTTACN